MRFRTAQGFLAAVGAVMLMSAPMSNAAPTPYSGTPVAVPGTIQAENFDRGGEGVAYHDTTSGNTGGQYRTSEGVDIFLSNDPAGGSYIVKDFRTGEWLGYTINASTSGNYDIELRAATSSNFPNRAFHVEIDGVNVTGTVVLPNTGGWNKYKWLGKKRVSLTAGTHFMKVVSDRQYFSLNSIRVTAAPTPTPYSGTPIAVPATIEAENFDRGGEGVAYHDNTTGNAGGQYRTNENVDIIGSSDPLGGGYVVNYFQTGEWLAYTITAPTSAQYDIELRASSAFSNSGFHVEIDGVNVTGNVTVPNTGGWGVFQWLGRKRVSLTAGTHVMKIVSDQEYFNLNSIRMLAASTTTPTPTPYSGTPIAVPGTFEAENFDHGGEGVAYHDNATGNTGGQYRTGEDVDIVAASDSLGGGYVVNNFQTGEWLGYTITVATGAEYDIELRAASAFSDSAFHIEIDGQDVTGRMTVPNTSGWDAFQWLGRKRVALNAGTHIMKIVADQEYFDLNSVRVADVVAVPQPDPSTVLFSCTFPNSPADCGFYEQAKVAGRASIVTVARDGLTAVRLHTEPGDSNVSGSGSAERNDLLSSQSATDCYQGREHWWAHSIRFPDDYVPPASGGWGVVMDFHHTGSSGQANFHVDAAPNPVGLRLRGYGGATVDAGRYEVTLGPVVKNVWYDFVYHVKWSSGSDGFLEAWVNGVKKLDHRGPTLYSGMGCYLKLANYHTPTGQPSSVIHDRVIRGTSALAVSPGPLDGVLALVDGVLTPIQ